MKKHPSKINKKIKNLSEKLIQKFSCHRKMEGLIFVLIFTVGPGVIAYDTYLKDLFSNSDELFVMMEEKLVPFNEESFGILVAPFEGITKEQINKGRIIQRDIVTIINARLKDLEINDAEARGIPSPMKVSVRTHEEAIKIGEKYSSKIVIWGDVNSIGYVPYITIISSNKQIEQIFDRNMSILKDELCHALYATVNEIRFPALTDEPISLVCFVTGLKYFENHQYNKALYYFQKSLPNDFSKDINADLIYVRIGLTQLFTSQYEDAELSFNKALNLNCNCYYAYAALGVYHALYSLDRKYDGLNLPFNLIAQKESNISEACELVLSSILSQSSLATAWDNRQNELRIKSIHNAISNFNKALQIKPEADLYIYFMRAVCFADINECEKAIADLSKITDKSEIFHFLRGNIYFLCDNHKKAQIELSRAIELNSKFALAYCLLAFTNIKEDPQNAISFIKRAVEIDPANKYFNFGEGILYLFVEDYDNAISKFSWLLKHDPNLIDAYIFRGDAYYNKKEFDKAIFDYNKSLELKENTHALCGLGKIYSEKCDYIKALSFFDKAIDITPTDHYLFSQRGAICLYNGDVNKAISDFNRALKLNPDDFHILLLRGFAYQQKGELEKSISDFNQAMKSSDNLKKGHMLYPTFFQRGVSKFLLGKFSEAFDDYHEACEKGKSAIHCINWRGLYHFLINEYEKAIADYSKALEIYPNNVEALFGRACVYLSAGRLDEAISDYTEILIVSANNVEALMRRAFAYKKMRKYEEAITDYTKVLGIDSNRVGAYLGICDIYIEKHEYKDAISGYRNILKIHSQYYHIHILIANCFEKIGKNKEAILEYKKFIQHASTYDLPDISFASRRIALLRKK